MDIGETYLVKTTSEKSLDTKELHYFSRTLSKPTELTTQTLPEKPSIDIVKKYRNTQLDELFVNTLKRSILFAIDKLGIKERTIRKAVSYMKAGKPLKFKMVCKDENGQRLFYKKLEPLSGMGKEDTKPLIIQSYHKDKFREMDTIDKFGYIGYSYNSHPITKDEQTQTPNIDALRAGINVMGEVLPKSAQPSMVHPEKCTTTRPASLN